MASQSAPLRVCIVTQNHPSVVIGGAEYQCHLVAQELASRNGVEVHYLARRAPQSGVCGDPAYLVSSLGQSEGLARMSLVFDARRLLHKLQEIQPDAIYQRMRISYTGVCQWYAAKAGIPLFAHVASDFDFDSCPLNFRDVSLKWPLQALDAAIGSWGLRRAAHIVVQTDRQAKLLRTRYGRRATLISQNAQPLPTHLAVRVASPLRVIWVGNLRPVKRPELFVELARRLSHIGNVEFLMVGRTYGGDYSRLLTSEAIPKNLRYLGALPRAEVLDLMANSHILVNTSATEGSPNTFIEAWGHGAVVVSLNVDVDGALKDLGVGLHAGDMHRLVELVERTLCRSHERQQIAARAFEYVHRTHSLANVRRLCDAIVSAAESARRRPVGDDVAVQV